MGLQARGVGENLARVISRIHLRINGGDFALAINQIADAIGIARARAIGGAIRDGHLVVGVGQQFEREIKFGRECGIARGIVEAEAENLDVGILECGVLVAEPATFTRSAGGVGLGIEPHQDFAAAQRGERERLAIMGLQFKIRRRVANLQHFNLFLVVG
jgi:hypothetical protein